jgi:hypothetical protein
LCLGLFPIAAVEYAAAAFFDEIIDTALRCWLVNVQTGDRFNPIPKVEFKFGLLRIDQGL